MNPFRVVRGNGDARMVGRRKAPKQSEWAGCSGVLSYRAGWQQCSLLRSSRALVTRQ